MGKDSCWKPESGNIIIESGVTTREEFERIQDELGMIPNTLFEKRDRKFLKCPNCNKETIHKRVFSEWQCSDCYKKE